MRPVSQSPAIEKRKSTQTVPTSHSATASFAEVLTATVQKSQPPVRPQVRSDGRAGTAAPPGVPTRVERPHTLPRTVPANAQLTRRSFSQTTNLLPLPPRPTARADLLSQQVGDSPPSTTRATIKTYGTMITAAAGQFGVDPAISLAVARAESGVSAATDKEVVLNPRAVSPDGSSSGLFQLTRATGKEQLQELAPRQTYNPFNASQNIRLGVSYLKDLSRMFSTDTTLRKGLSTTAGANAQEVQRLSIAAYNAGPGRVARAQALVRAQGGNPARYQDIAPHLPRETQVYVRRVEQYAAEFRGANTVSG